ncbi:MAG: hypothetical protein ND807_05020 [Vicinamibacterales bacterium]|nr:hypothetical protein [Vicinamibacterales bacterium]
MFASWWQRLTRPVRAQPAPGLNAAPEPVLKSYSGEYKGLHKYLRERYANRVVLSFGEIEDLLGFSLPGPARLQAEWWDSGGVPHRSAQSDSWTLASRTATVNLLAQNVLFERS